MTFQNSQLTLRSPRPSPRHFFARTALVAVAILAVCLGAVPVRAAIAEDALFEMNLSAGLTSPSGAFKDYFNSTSGATSGIAFKGSGGYYIKSGLQLGVYVTYAQFSTDALGGRKHRLYDAGGFIKKHFALDKKVSPFLRAELGFVTPSIATPLLPPAPPGFREIAYSSSYGVGFGAGARFSTFDHGGFFIEVDYRKDFIGGKTGNNAGLEYTLPEDTGYLVAHAGFSFDFGPKN